MAFWNTTKTFKGDNTPKTTSTIYCGASAFRDACYQLVSGFLITYITLSGLLSKDPKEFGLQFLVITIIQVICLIWDGFNDPIMGWIIEKFHFKWGKYKPWILIGGILNTGVVLTLFLARPTGWGFVALFGVFYFLWDIVWTINDIAYWSMLPSLTKDEQKRNRITSIMQIAISVGVFGVYAAVPNLVGAFEGVSAQTVYGIIAIVVTSLYLISQILLVIGCKERDRSEDVDKPDDVKFSDMIKLFKKNDQFRVNIIAILLNYLGSGVLVGFAMYYFYLMFGYGAEAGGSIQFIFTVMYAVGTLLSQIAYPLLSKFLTRKKIFITSGICLLLGYTLFFIMGMPLFGKYALAVSHSWALIVMYASAVILFFGQGLIAVAIIIQMQSTIEYNEYKHGERKEALVSSMRALVAKFGSAIQRLLIFVTLAVSGLQTVSNVISNGEAELNNGIGTLADLTDAVNKAREQITQGQWFTFSIGMIGVPVLALIGCIILSVFVFKIDEKKYKEIVDELNIRRGTTETSEK